MYSLFILNIFFTISLTILGTVYGGRNFYKILQVTKTAEHEEIKRSYKKLILELHPDKNKDDPNATQKFQNVRDAYEVLSDAEKRQKYDMCGEECVGKDAMQDSGSFSNFFGDFFSFGNGESGGGREPVKGGNIIMDLFVTLEELYNGNFIEITRNKPIATETKGTRRCNCRQEMVTKSLGPGRFQMMQKTVCDECPEVIFKPQQKTLEIEIEPGMREGQESKFVAEGEPHVDGEPGDLILKVRTVGHKIFERRGDDLYTNITISLVDSIVGFKMSLKHLDGRTIQIEREKLTRHGAKMRKRGEGMPNYENNHVKGDLFITFDVEYPKVDLTQEEKDVIKNILKQESIGRVYNGLRSK